jgi:hypothetical protein
MLVEYLVVAVLAVGGLLALTSGLRRRRAEASGQADPALYSMSASNGTDSTDATHETHAHDPGAGGTVTGGGYDGEGGAGTGH